MTEDRQLRSLVLDVVDAYEAAIGSVPLRLLTYHVNKNPRKRGQHVYTKKEVGQAADLLVEKGMLKTCRAYYKRRK